MGICRTGLGSVCGDVLLWGVRVVGGVYLPPTKQSTRFLIVAGIKGTDTTLLSYA